MVKNLDTKEIWKFSKSFVKREGILLLACVLAVASSLAVVPKAEYIDWRVLVLLYCLMLVVGGFKKRRVLDNCAVRLLQRCISLRQITAALLLITFISSMLVTNDVALITFVPLTLIIGKEAGVDVGKIIVWQTLAANLGSMLTPMGNPQNLFLYARYNFDIFQGHMDTDMFSSGFAGSIFNAPAGQAVKSKLDLCECRTWLGADIFKFTVFAVCGDGLSLV